MRQVSIGIIRDMIRTSALALLFSAIPMLTVQAQTLAPIGPLNYDAFQEVSLSGTVTGVLTKAATGMIPGVHLLLMTANGVTDVSLGTASLRGTGVLALAAGQQVEVVGVTKTIKQKQVFLARTVQAGSHVYVIRNVHGIPVSQIGRERTNQNAGHDGDTL